MVNDNKTFCEQDIALDMLSPQDEGKVMYLNLVLANERNVDVVQKNERDAGPEEHQLVDDEGAENEQLHATNQYQKQLAFTLAQYQRAPLSFMTMNPKNCIEAVRRRSLDCTISSGP
jgi:hypothetical protein